MIATEGVLINCIGKLAFTVKEMMARFIYPHEAAERTSRSFVVWCEVTYVRRRQ